MGPKPINTLQMDDCVYQCTYTKQLT